MIIIANLYNIPAQEFEKQYKNHISGFRVWEQISHAEEWILFPENIGTNLSIDETSLSNGELYTIVTNKKAGGRKGAIVAMIHVTKSSVVEAILKKIPLKARLSVQEVTLDMAGAMDLITKNSFPNAIQVTDRFHVQQVVSEAVQEIKIDYRKTTIKEENGKIEEARKTHRRYRPSVYENEDTKKQLLARSRHLLFKPESRWTERQLARARILFREFPNLKKAKDIESFNVAAQTIRLHETTILNYFNNRSTNASAESLDAKLKAFRSIVRGVRDRKFHLFRITKLYA